MCLSYKSRRLANIKTISEMMSDLPQKNVGKFKFKLALVST